jgi:hypothetical protein
MRMANFAGPKMVALDDGVPAQPASRVDWFA